MAFLTQLNWYAIAVGAVFNVALGALWYGPLFGAAWLRAIGKKQEEIEGGPWMYLVPLAASLASAYVLAAAIRGLGLTVWWHGVAAGGILWLGVGASATLTTGTFDGTPRAAWALHAMYQLIAYAAMGLVFVLWK